MSNSEKWFDENIKIKTSAYFPVVCDRCDREGNLSRQGYGYGDVYYLCKECFKIIEQHSNVRVVH